MKINFKKIVLIFLATIMIIIGFMNYIKSQELQWKKQDLANVIGNFENSELISENDTTQIWIVKQYNSEWKIIIEDNHLISKIKL